MRLKQFALATLFGAAMALPALAQPATTTAPVARPSTSAPAMPAPTAPTTPMKPMTAAPTTATTAPTTATTAPSTGTATTGTAATTKPSKVTGPVNVNTATAAELDALPGIGKARLKKIIAGRPYKAVDEIDTRKIIPHNVYENIKGSLTI